jgi:hypothetical protein
MKLIIAGSRSIPPQLGKDLVLAAVFAAKALGWEIGEVVCGEARGIDRCGWLWAEHQGIPIKSFPADWGQHGKKAGYMRNEDMAAYADALIAITNGSPGTRHMIEIARRRKMPVIVIEIP